MATTGWKFAGTCLSTVTSESSNAWVNSGTLSALGGSELSADDGTFAYCSVPAENTSQSLRARNFGFTSSDVPPGATINGVEMRITRYASGTGLQELTRQLVTGTAGTTADRIGANQSAAAALPTSEAAVTVGGAADLWGSSSAVITQAVVTGSAFGMDFRVRETDAVGRIARVDCVECRITYTPAGPTYTLTAAAGTFSLTGQAANFKRQLRLLASAGAFTMTGRAAGLRVSRRLVAAAGSYAMTGYAATLLRLRILTAQAGSFALTGQAAGLRVSRRLVAGAGSFTLTGQAAGLKFARRLVAEAGSFVLTGGAAGLRAARRLVAEAGAFVATYWPISLIYSGATIPGDLRRVRLNGEVRGVIETDGRAEGRVTLTGRLGGPVETSARMASRVRIDAVLNP